MTMNYRMYIDGRWVDAHNGGTWKVIDPATEEVIQEVPFGDGTDAEAVSDGFVSVTPLQVDLTHYPSIDSLAERYST